MLKPLRAWWVLAVVVAGMTLAMTACSDDDNGGDGGDTPTVEATDEGPGATRTPYPAGQIVSPEQVLEKDPDVTNYEEIEWGWMFELSGPPQVQGFGVPTGDGVKLAVQEINKAGGFQVGDTIYTIKLIERDTKSEVANTIAVTNELVNDFGVKVIFGPATLGEPEATVITQRAQVLHFCPCQEREQGALSSLEKAQGESRWAFQTLLPFSLLIEQGAQNFGVEYPQFSSMALICQNSVTGRNICEQTRDAYAAEGVEIIGDIQYFPVGTVDYKPYLTNLIQGDPDYLFNYDNPENTATIVRQALELGVGRLQLVTLPANLVRALVGRELTVPVSAGAAPRQEVQPTSQKAADYFERYKAYLGKNLPPAAFVSLFTYDYVYMVAAAMQQAGTVDDTTAIAEALEQLHYDGVAEDDLFFNSGHFSVHGTEPCTVETDPVKGDPEVTISCAHNPPPDAAYY